MTNIIKHEPQDNKLQLSPITLDREYAKKWNAEHIHDFLVFTKNGEMLRPTLYRKGGLFDEKAFKSGKYFVLLKYIEEYYEDSITINPKRKPHLAGHWCILDKDGNEKVVTRQWKSLSVYGILYYLDNEGWFNIETSYHYGKYYTNIQSENYLFLESGNKWSEEGQKVMKIDKRDGSFEIFK